uniref:Dual specificity phosphatase catalytic domain-containing protein n=1 Tax=Cyclopterus lumpus TaxID=8103 RepID=A0A8C3G6H2_CYCLU
MSIHDTAAPILEVSALCLNRLKNNQRHAVKLCALSVAGVSRSVTLVVAYIMTATGRGWVESLAAVRAVRPCAGPNLGFLRQLEEFENTGLTEVSDADLIIPLPLFLFKKKKKKKRFGLFDKGCNMQQSSAVRIKLCDTRCNRLATSGASACLPSGRCNAAHFQ